MLPSANQNELANLNPDVLEPYLLTLPQAPCPVVHHFGPGLYVREVTIPSGAFAMGHKQRFEHLNIVLKGSVAVLNDDGSVSVIKAPALFVGKPGRKVGACIDECVWQNVYANPDNCRDIEALEARYLEKTDIALAYERLYVDCLSKHHESDREDYAEMLSELGMTDEQVRAETEIQSDMVDFPNEYATKVSIRPSPIQGKGLFLSSPADAGEVIAPARIGDCRTIAGRFVNHSKSPNCEYRKMPSGDIYLVAKAEINGALGGSAGCELTADYRQALEVSGRMEVLQ